MYTLKGKLSTNLDKGHEYSNIQKKKKNPNNFGMAFKHDDCHHLGIEMVGCGEGNTWVRDPG